MTATTYKQTSPKKARRPQDRSLPLRDAITTVADAYTRLTVRQLYYQLVARQVIEKTEKAYKRVCAVSGQMRHDGTLAYGKIADGHRTRHHAYTCSDLAGALHDIHSQYRRNYWDDQPYHVEIWCEKDALSGVIRPVCDELRVPYVATRGFPSLTLIYESAGALLATGKPAHIFYFGDHDASGQSISAGLEPALQAHGAPVQVQRVALSPKQIIVYNLPTRPGKESDSRHARFADTYGDACVELDALPPDVLATMVRQCITAMIEPHAWDAAAQLEVAEGATLRSLAAIRWQPGQHYTPADVRPA